MDAFPEAATDPAIHARQVAAQRLSHRCAQLADLATTPSHETALAVFDEMAELARCFGMRLLCTQIPSATQRRAT